jgi:DNA end-binding protein Ku
LEPQKGGDKAYVLLRDTLKKTGKVGIAKVVIKTRQYLAGVKAEKQCARSRAHAFCRGIG